MAEPNQTSGGPNAEMPRYRSHKIVHALKIKSIAAGETQATLHFEQAFDPITVATSWLNNHYVETGGDGGYYVVYEDGYQSWSPTKAFEEGYMLITPSVGPTRQQEPKYTTDARGRFINRTTGQPIPDDEPVFILRGKDVHTVAALQLYASLCTLPDQRAVAKSRLLDFKAFAEENPERMKEPDPSLTDVAAATRNPGRWKSGERGFAGDE